MVNLELAGIGVITARHTEVPHDELREECEIETDISDEGGELSQFFRIHAASDFWPPVVKAAHKGSDHSADHDVVKMGDNEVGVRQMNVYRQGGEEQPGQTADDEQPDETQGVKHRRLERD